MWEMTWAYPRGRGGASLPRDGELLYRGLSPRTRGSLVITLVTEP